MITDPADLITGPLGHSRIGDYLLESCEARFVVQAPAQRDLYSVNQYGGNLIDAELKGRPGLDNFLAIAPMANIETVLNPQTAVIVNDGSDGNPAVVRTCGPDDLLDFVNPSSRSPTRGFPSRRSSTTTIRPWRAARTSSSASTTRTSRWRRRTPTSAGRRSSWSSATGSTLPASST